MWYAREEYLVMTKKVRTSRTNIEYKNSNPSSKLEFLQVMTLWLG